ncbi:hypothetical protein GCM10028801_10400 [Nocardioides maradonensis]
MTDPRDPLAGLDPYPRDLIDTLGLHRERADLLEDIVSTPGPAHPARTRALLAVAVAAAVAVIGGGWFLVSGNDGHDEAPVAAASATTSATAPTTSPTTGPTSAPTSGATHASRCQKAVARNGQLRRILPLLRQGELGKHPHRGRFYLRATKDGREYVVVTGEGCTLRELRSLSATHH